MGNRKNVEDGLSLTATVGQLTEFLQSDAVFSLSGLDKSAALSLWKQPVMKYHPDITPGAIV